MEAHDSAPRLIVARAVDGLDFIGEKSIQPGEFDGGGEAEMGNDFAGFDLGDLAGDEGGGMSGAGNLVEFAPAVSDESAGEVALGDADGKLIREGGEDGFGDGFAVGVEVDVLRGGFRKQT